MDEWLVQLANSIPLHHQHVGKRDKFVESEIALWIEAVLDDCIPPKPFDELVKDGVLLCRVMNTLQAGSVSKIKKPFTKENQMENINSFLNAAKAYGVPEDKLFKPEELNPGDNIPNVINSLLALGRACFDKGWEGPTLGPKPTGQKKDWPEQVLRASEAIVPQQLGGSFGFATQKGISFGAMRDIITTTKFTAPVKPAENKEEATA